MTGNENRLGPDDLVGREFAIGLRGYDRDEVDAFLAQAAEAWQASLSAAPSTGLSTSAMAALAEAEEPRPTAADDTPVPADVFPPSAPADLFAGPVVADPFAAPVAPATEPARAEVFSVDGPVVLAPEFPDHDAGTQAYEAGVGTLATAPEPPVEAEPAPVPATQAETERDRTAAYAERVAAELDRAAARTELAKAQEEALHIIDQAQRRAEVVLTGARDKAQAEAETVLEDARSRLTPLLEQERAVRARLARLRSELDAMVGDTPSSSASATLTPPEEIVASAEDDPSTPEAPFPVGYGSIAVDR